MLIIRRAAQADITVLKEFQQEIVEAERFFDPTLKPGVLFYYDLDQLIISPDAIVLVAEENGVLAGTGFAQIRTAQEYLRHSVYIYLGFMFTRPEARGKGINKKILEGLMEWSRMKGIDEIRLEVFADNKIARQAYNNFGFQEHLVEMRYNPDKAS
ncbi:MAG: GNAT family N-acetyltransferase [Bacteroidota bacterium]